VILSETHHIKISRHWNHLRKILQHEERLD